MENKIVSSFKYLLDVLVIYIVIAGVWVGYEKIFIGEVKPDIFHSIIAAILANAIVIAKECNKITNEYESLVKKQNETIDELIKVCESQQEVIQLYEMSNEKKEKYYN